MLKRYVAIRGFVYQLNDRTILSLLPTDEQDKDIDILLGILGELESGTKDLQAEDSTILARATSSTRRSCYTQMRPSNPSDKPLTLAERAKKRKKTSHEEFNYLDCRFLRPTSNMCERFFSLAKLALTDHRRAMTPQNFEQQMFLKVNNWLWYVSDLVKAMSK
ncbi:hypothetical protein DYB25_012446 [Aphanomyces astaci]|uniref:HAT C-terminal dimerisation domain-containing protein n=1 Tax=Aphanomyces astaci TaxID=112090 RepID=A0A397B395_APHAT|nr:hypothetical protein DYB25_012446 [Aphanomyces astaci]